MTRWHCAVLSLATTMFAATSCQESHTRLDQEGDPCRALLGFCVDDEQAMVCVDEIWTTQDCEQLCVLEAPGVVSGGCAAVSPVEGGCVCLPPAGGCVPGEARCGDDGLIELCNDDWAWSTYPCVDVCAAHPTHTSSLGCEPDDMGESASCSCTSAGTSCSDDPPVCIDDAILAACSDGVWSQEDCAEACDGEAACVPGVGGASCVCG